VVVDRLPGDGAVLRPGRDRERPAVDTAVAAERLGLKRYTVARKVQQGALPGYGIPGQERVRWYVYEDALPPPARPADQEGDLALAHVLAQVLSHRARHEAEEAEADAAALQSTEREARARARRLLAQADLDREAERRAQEAAEDCLRQARESGDRATAAEKEARVADARADEAAAAAHERQQQANRLLRGSLVRADDVICRTFLSGQAPLGTPEADR
jgi:hypothetical protein